MGWGRGFLVAGWLVDWMGNGFWGGWMVFWDSGFEFFGRGGFSEEILSFSHG